MTTLPERSSHMWITRCAWICLQESAEMSHIGGQRRNATPWKLKGIQTFFLDIMTFKSVLVSFFSWHSKEKQQYFLFLLNVLILGVELLIKLLILQFWKKFAETRPSNFVKMFHETLSSQFQEKLSSKNALQSLRFDALQSKSRFQKDNVTLN